jgi:hypothetical protein
MPDASGELPQEDPRVTGLVDEISKINEKLREAGLEPGERYRLETRLHNAKTDLAALDEAL